MNCYVGKFLSPLSLTISMMVVGLSSASAADVSNLIEPCAGCHGKDGVSTESDIPIISGNSAAYIMSTMEAYRNKERPCAEVKINAGPHKGELADMCKIAKDLSEPDAKLVAEYFAAKPFVRATQEFDADKAKLGKIVQDRDCKKCHEEGGSSAGDDAGILAGQWAPYIRQQFKEFSSGERPMTKKMQKKYEKLDETDIENLVHYFASFK